MGLTRAARIAALKGSGVVPGLGTLLVGEDPGSLSYVAGKHRDCAEVGIESIRVDLPAAASEDGREGCTNRPLLATVLAGPEGG